MTKAHELPFTTGTLHILRWMYGQHALLWAPHMALQTPVLLGRAQRCFLTRAGGKVGRAPVHVQGEEEAQQAQEDLPVRVRVDVVQLGHELRRAAQEKLSDGRSLL